MRILSYNVAGTQQSPCMISPMKPPLLSFSLLLLFTLADVTPLRADVLKRISEQEFVHEIVEIQDKVWLATDTGAYRVDGETPTRVSPPQDMVVKTIAEVRGQPWLGSEKGLFAVRGARAEPILEEGLGGSLITAIRVVGDDVWLGTDAGLKRVEGDTLSPAVIRGGVNAVEVIDGRVWVGTRFNGYRANDSGGFDTMFSTPTEVSKIVAAGGNVWFVTNREMGRYGPCFLFDGAGAAPVESLGGREVISVADIGGEPWFGTTRGVFGLDGQPPSRLSGMTPTEPINAVGEIQGQVWLGSTKRAYRELSGNLRPIPTGGENLGIKEIVLAAGRTWLRSSTGAYRLERDVEMRISPTTLRLMGAEVSLGRIIGIREARYHDASGLVSSVPGDFEVVLHWQQKGFDEELAAGDFAPANSLTRVFPLGFQTLYIVGRDPYGNTTLPEARPVLVLPALRIALAILTPIAWWLLAFVLLILAPWSSPVMNLLMVPTVRKIGSLWAIPVALAFGPVRRHLLRRYVRELREFCILQKWNDSSGLPPKESEILAELAARHKARVTGDPVTTRRYLRYLTSRLAGDEIGRQLDRAVPVFLRLEFFGKDLEDLESGACLLLDNFGGFTDSALAKMLLKRGGFVFLLDGGDRIDADGCVTLAKFIEGYQGRNFIIVDSGEVDDEHASIVTFDIGEQLSEALELEEPAPDAGHYSCFISYSHEDGDFAQKLRAELERRQIRSWLDVEDMTIGAKILDSVVEAIRRHDKVLLCCSEASLTSPFVDDEISTAIEKERELGQLVLMPLNLDGYLFEGWRSGHAPRIRERLAADFVAWENDSTKLNQQVGRLVRALARPTEESDEPEDGS